MAAVTKAKTYKVTAKRWARGWELHIDGVGVTQSHTLTGAEEMVRDYIALDKNVPSDSFNVEIVVTIDANVDPVVMDARRAVIEAAALQRRAAEQSREVVALLKKEGLSGREIATVLGVSPQRVSQLASAGER